MQGRFITLYGINNIGKSTQAKLLVERLKKEGKKAVYLKYPIYDLEPTGPKLNSILRSKEQTVSEEELQLLFVQNRIDFEPQLLRYLEDGYYVVAEDYIGTGIAWGASKGADLQWLEAINAPLLHEDLPIYMKGKRFLQAKEDVHIHETNDELIKRCEETFDLLAKKLSWNLVQATGSLEEVAENIWQIVVDKTSDFS